ncbi:MAG: DUF2934 domain-containing protein [Vicinamibacterales bacterium]
MAKNSTRRKGAAAAARTREGTRSSPPIDRDAIARRAYDRYLARGCGHEDLEDWLQAERDLLQMHTSAID